MFGLGRRQQILLFLILGALLFGGGIRYALHLHNGGAEGLVVGRSQPNLPAAAEPKEPGTIFIHVIGAVQKPGIYELPAKSRVFEAVEKAVPLPEAELQALNLAKLLRDEEKVIVPWVGEVGGNSLNQAQTPGLNPRSGSNPETIGSGPAAGISSGENEKLDLNTASSQELDARLPGIGPTLAQRIIDYRQQHGAFRSIEDLKNVAGIGEKRFDQLKGYITVNP